MRACAAILFFAAWPCFIHAQISRSRENNSNFANGINENLIRLVPCVKNLGLSKCVSAYGAWRAEKSLEANAQMKTLYSEKFPWQRYYNVSDVELYSKLCDGAERLLQRRSLTLNLNQDYSLQLGVTGNGSLNVDVFRRKQIESDVASGRGSMKKIQKYFYELVPFILLPGLLMSAILPFFLPTLKMMTLGAGLLNNMALTGAVFTLLRNNAFNDKYEKKVIYLNNGYLNDKYEPLADTPSEYVVDGDFDKYGDKYAGVETNEVKDFQITGSEPLHTDYQISSDWLKQITGKATDVKIFRNDYKGNDWANVHDIENNIKWMGREN